MTRSQRIALAMAGYPVYEPFFFIYVKETTLAGLSRFAPQQWSGWPVELPAKYVRGSGLIPDHDVPAAPPPIQYVLIAGAKGLQCS